MSGPYADAFDQYYRAGWRSMLPLPARAKKYPPSGYTGGGGKDPSYADMFAWSETHAASNIALRMPPNVIGIDVDNYGDKDGATSLAIAEATYGELPPTWRSTSRDDGVSGIRFYRVPEGLDWPGEIGESIEIIQRHHRYSVAWPSVHPEGGTYRWVTPEGVVSTQIPNPDDFPLLPDAWVEGYTGGELATHTKRVDVKAADAMGWFVGADHSTDIMCDRMNRATEQHAHELSGSAHNSTRDAVLRIARLTNEGHHGAVAALAQVRQAFLTEATSQNRDLIGMHRRTQPEAEREFTDLAASAVGVILADPADVATCDCYGQITGAITSTPQPQTNGSSALDPMPAAGHEHVNVDPEDDSPQRFKDGAAFILDAPEAPPNVWGDGDESLWAEGEALMICGPPGVGKTTVTGQILRARIGLQAEVLGASVTESASRVLYLAMDRPAQIARGLRRTFKESDREILTERVRFWEGPPPGDVAKHPTVLLSLAQLAEADTIIIDSIKDAAVGLSEDDIGAAYNRARQNCLANGVQVLELHHMVKRGANGNKPKELADVYGSAWLTAGAGSVILLWGAAGDLVVDMAHLKQPAAEVGPWQLIHNHDAGITEVSHGVDVLQAVRMAGGDGVTVRSIAHLMSEDDAPSKNDTEKARRKLEALVSGGHAVKVAGTPRSSGGTPESRYVSPDQAVDNYLSEAAGSSHESSHAQSRESYPQAATPSHAQSRENLETPELQGDSQSRSQSRQSRSKTAPPVTQAPPSLEGEQRSDRRDSEQTNRTFCKECGQQRPLGGLCPDCDRPRGGDAS